MTEKQRTLPLCMLILIVLIGCAKAEQKKGILRPGDIRYAVGRIFDVNEKERKGTAFVAGETFSIFTPAHVAIADTVVFVP